MKVKREKRLNSEFQKEIYELLTTKVKDVRLTEMFSKYQTVITTADSGYVGSVLNVLGEKARPKIIEVSEGRFKNKKEIYNVFENKTCKGL